MGIAPAIAVKPPPQVLTPEEIFLNEVEEDQRRLEAELALLCSMDMYGQYVMVTPRPKVAKAKKNQ